MYLPKTATLNDIKFLKARKDWKAYFDWLLEIFFLGGG